MKLNPVAAKTGLVWIKLGMKTFFRQPLAMAGLFFMYMGIISMLTLIPLAGSALALALLPAATLGLMAAARQADDGRFPMPSVLGSAFAAGKQRMHAMLRLGVMYALAFMTVMGASALFDGGQFAQVYLSGDKVTEELARQPEFQHALWVAMTLYVPLALLFWHAPALVHWHGVSPAKSLFFSALACWTNKGAMLVFAIGWVGVFLLGGVAMSLLVALIGNAELAGFLLLPSVLLMASMFFTSTYFSFRDSFTDDDATPTQGEPT